VRALIAKTTHYKEKQMNKKLEKLLKQREEIEAAIAHEKMIAERSDEVRHWREFNEILTLPDSVLRAAFAKIASENNPAN
jgi:vacuolar-type H+-ATPase subunit F/Vma7